MTNTAPGHQQDLTLPETFHRLKRTILLLASSLIVLGLGKPEATATLHLPLMQLALPSLWLRLLLLGALAYYCWGFWFEVSTARSLNSQLLANNQIGSRWDIFLQRFMEHSTREANELRTNAARMVAMDIETRARNAESLAALSAPLSAEETDALIQGIVPNISQWSAEEQDRFVRQVMPMIQQTLERRNDVAKQFLRRMDDASETSLPVSTEGLLARLEELDRKISVTGNDLHRLNKAIIGARRTSFYLWELGGAYGAALFAVIVGFAGLIPAWSSLLRQFY